MMKNFPNIFMPLYILAVLTFITFESKISSAASSGVVLMYHRFGEAEYPSTNIRLDQFAEHLAELKSGKYNVLSLEELTEAIIAGEDLPERTVALTIDDGFRSVYENAWPMIKESELPFTMFISSGLHEEQRFDYMTWDQIREMADGGVTIAGHGLYHDHMAGLDETTSLKLIQEDYELIREKLGEAPKLFAYPYGEASLTLMKQVESMGYIAAFGQQSGALAKSLNPFYLPRFPVNERYGELDRIRMNLNTIGLAVEDLLPEDPLLERSAANNPPAIGFTLPRDLDNTDQLACYHSKIGKVEDLQLIGKFRVEMRFEEAFEAGRTRINCTLPAENGRWYWFGLQYFTK
ncbi:MAG: polysaccharide deacetylase family protein [Alphaproteobacteria bacterium]|nr:polysaccharide deacetylase family protein [Alphaproteobacteria bacterium]